MKAKKQVIEALGALNTADLLKVYNLVLSIQNSTDRLQPKPRVSSYLKVRESLRNCKGSLANDIINDREERL
jgi:hypothetical protein